MPAPSSQSTTTEVTAATLDNRGHGFSLYRASPCPPFVPVSSVVLLLLVGTVWAQGPSNWAQFRGNLRLSGLAPVAPPDTLALKWTYEAGESIESSAAIVDGAV
jgi:hypothetical protein